MWHVSQPIKDETNGLESVCGILASPLKDPTLREPYIPKRKRKKKWPKHKDACVLKGSKQDWATQTVNSQKKGKKWALGLPNF